MGRKLGTAGTDSPMSSRVARAVQDDDGRASGEAIKELSGAVVDDGDEDEQALAADDNARKQQPTDDDDDDDDSDGDAGPMFQIGGAVSATTLTVLKAADRFKNQDVHARAKGHNRANKANRCCMSYNTAKPRQIWDMVIVLRQVAIDGGSFADHHNIILSSLLHVVHVVA